MKMYVWESEYLRGCRNSGQIVVIASDVREARRLAKEEFSRQFQRSVIFDNGLERFRADLKETPKTKTVLLNFGSD